MAPSRRRNLTDRQVAALEKKSKRYTVADPDLRGHYVRVMPEGSNVFVAVCRDPYGKQVWTKIGTSDVLKIEDARERARQAIKRVRAGLPAFEAPPVKPESFKSVADNWLVRHVEKKGLRSHNEIVRCLQKYVYPHWQNREFVSIRRSDITKLLDHVEDNHGARQADMVGAIIRGISNWHAKRDDHYVSPFVRGMRRTDPASHKRDRILDDEELRLVWSQAENSGTFGAIIQLLQLTAQRREKVTTMKWADLSDGTWHIPENDREKGTAGALVLPESALAIIQAQPRIGDSPYVFAGRGENAFNGFSKCKKAFDANMPSMPRWTLHDLRRTARSLMSRAGVRPDIAERVLGHAIPGVEGVYDRHRYLHEKGEALRQLAGLIESIIKPPTGNVRPLRRGRAS